ncbi:DUF1218 domain-containing protein [Cephalotus follicularis]|uniref:DUF1218 domain-containing protein n=1 Tax=Cephalotus follicularis TaxID=3775 RepID=A0A1Q3BBC3_CEPFO|nr:DUF1218 domain-containing protein [Cephalotus follicularis]
MQVLWISSDNNNGKDEENNECVYNGSGQTPLLCAAIALVCLAISMVIQYIYMLIATSKSPPPALEWDSNYAPAESITWQACLFFVTTLICFGVGEILLLIGLSVESGHLRNWSRPKPSCLVIKEGLFSAAGGFALTSVFFATCLYLTALRAQRISEKHVNIRRQVLEISTLHASPPRPPPHRIATIARENPIVGELQNEQSSMVIPQAFSKHWNSV